MTITVQEVKGQLNDHMAVSSGPCSGMSIFTIFFSSYQTSRPMQITVHFLSETTSKVSIHYSSNLMTIFIPGIRNDKSPPLRRPRRYCDAKFPSCKVSHSGPKDGRQKSYLRQYHQRLMDADRQPFYFHRPRQGNG